MSDTALPRTIETERLILRCPQVGDGAPVNAAVRASWAALSAWMDWAQGAPPEIAETEARMASQEAAFAAREDLSFALWLKADGSCAGKASVFRLDGSVPKGEIGYWLRSDLVGRGLMTEAAGALTAYAFGTLGLVRVEIRCDDRNVRSAAVAERLGYALEGVLRRECRDAAGNLRDTRVYAMVKP